MYSWEQCKEWVRTHQERNLWDFNLLNEWPEFRVLSTTLQNPQWHPEGNTLIHTILVCEEGLAIVKREKLNEEETLILLFSCLLHDIAKPKCTIGKYPNIKSPQHDSEGGPLAEKILFRIGAPPEFTRKISVLVSRHMSHLTCQTTRAVARLKNKLETAGATFEMLLWLIEADYGGRPPLPKGLPPKAQKMKGIHDTLYLQSPTSPDKKQFLINGKLVRECFGEIDGPKVGGLVRDGRTAQLAGEFTSIDGAKDWLKKQKEQSDPCI